MKWYPFSAVVTDVTSKFKKIRASDYKVQGKYRIIDQGKGPVAGYTDDDNLVNGQLLPILIFGDHTRALKFEDRPIALGADGTKALQINSDVGIALYVYYYLRSVKIKEAGYSRHFKFLKEIQIPIPFKDGAPDFDEQVRIAGLLSKVDGLIVQRAQHLQHLDDLLKSVFLEMFGDPVRNEKGWKIDSLGAYGGFKNGLNFGKGESGEKVRYLGVGDFKSKATLAGFDNLAFIDLNELPSEEHYLRDGDLVFVRSNGNRELVGRCISVYPGAEKAVFSGFCIRYRIANGALLAIYVAHLFRSTAFRRVLFQGGQGANIQNINQQILSGLPIPIPAGEVQSRFAAIVGRVEVLKSVYQASLTDLETLYRALSQKAFKGELDLSRLQFSKTREPESNEMTSSQPSAPEVAAISLPYSDLLLAALNDREKLEALLGFWLQAYTEQLGDRAFSVDEFIRAAESRAELTLPDREFELGADAYDLIKEWVFDALSDRRLEQVYPSTDIHVALRKPRAAAEG